MDIDKRMENEITSFTGPSDNTPPAKDDLVDTLACNY